MKSKSSSPVVIVRKHDRKAAHHHGGSWKIAYADFMTAMMAFFLVMWLLSSSSHEQRQQISEYFKMPLKAALAQGNKISLSKSIIPGGGDDITRQDGEVLKKQLKRIDDYKSQQNLQRARDNLQSLVKTDPRLSNFQSNLRISLTNEGLLIQITDSQEHPMFRIGSQMPEPYMVNILQALAPVLNELPNHVEITGHTDSLPYVNGGTGYGNWELSSERANASRRILVNGGLTSDKFFRVIGAADTQSQGNTRPDDPVNRRISILVLAIEKGKPNLAREAEPDKMNLSGTVHGQNPAVPLPVQKQITAIAQHPVPGAKGNVK